LFVIDTVHSAVDTISKLEAVEAERDGWQRAPQLIGALDLHSGSVVVDLGCGSGYFTLKLSSSVGADGQVIAEDIRSLPLAFLWARTVLKNKRNIRILRGKVTDPRLPATGVNSVLVVNTYHEFTDTSSILANVWNSLVPGGRLVIADRAPNPINIGTIQTGGHEIAASDVQEHLRQAHFEMVSRQDRFIDTDPYGESWWLIVARRP
jgi:ubiquinone/menaquinone biosynthesis C-methylase UbiE